MPKYEISTKICLGYSHMYSVSGSATGTLTLTEGQAERLRRMAQVLLSEGQDLSKYDLYDTDLEQEDPALYNVLYEAYEKCAYEAEYNHWIEAYYGSPEVLEGLNWKLAREICREAYGYSPKYFDESEVEAEFDEEFQEWFKENIAYSSDVIDFERNVGLLDIWVEGDYDVPLLFPPSLINEVLNSQPQK